MSHVYVKFGILAATFFEIPRGKTNEKTNKRTHKHRWTP